MKLLSSLVVCASMLAAGSSVFAAIQDPVTTDSGRNFRNRRLEP